MIVTMESTKTHPLRALLWLLALVAFAEFVLLRFVGALSFDAATAGGPAAGGVLPAIGAFCMDLGTVLAFVSLLAFALTPLRWRTGWSFVVVSYVVLGVVLPWASAMGAWVPVAYGALSAALTVVAGLVAIYRPDARGRVAVAVLLLAFICAFVYALSPAVLHVQQAVAPGGPGTLAFGEGLYLLGGIFAFAAWGAPRIRTDRTPLLGGLAAAVGLSIYIGVGGPSASAALTSATGLTLFLPLWVYVVSTFFFATTALACLRDKTAFSVGAAFVFFLVAGILPGSSYQQSLLVLGMILLAHEERAFQTAPDEIPAPIEPPPTRARSLLQQPEAVEEPLATVVG